MQEEVENRAVTLVISATKLTGRLLKAAILKYLASRKEKRLQKARAAPEKPTGKQTVKQLIGQNQGVSNIEITDSNIKKYLLASLFNAPSTIGSYYSALVNHDMYGDGLRGR